MPKRPKEPIPIESIVSKIIILRGTRVMLDRDLAEMYGVETRVLNQAVSWNIKRFPEDFMITITRDEIMRISQIVTSSKIKFSKRVRVFTEQGVAMLSSIRRQFGTLKRGAHSKYPPMAFTEQGVAMLSPVIKHYREAMIGFVRPMSAEQKVCICLCLSAWVCD